MSAITLATRIPKLDSERIKSRDRTANLKRRLPTQLAPVSGIIFRGLGDGPVSIPWQSDVMPAQFEQAQNWSNEMLLLAAVLQDAIACARRDLHPTRWVRNRECAEARAWIASRSDSYTFDFEAICLTLHLDAGRIRACLKAEREGA